MRDREDVHPFFFIVVTVRWKGEQERMPEGKKSIYLPVRQ